MTASAYVWLAFLPLFVLLSHLIGDYALQSHIMANKKRASWGWAWVHAGLYSIPYAALLFLYGAMGMVNPLVGLLALVVIGGTHAAIDRLGLAARYAMWWGVGYAGVWWRRSWTAEDRENAAQRYYEEKFSNLPGYVPWHKYGNSDMQAEARRLAGDGFVEPPPFLRVWLTIIVDNTLHLTINALCVLGAVLTEAAK